MKLRDYQSEGVTAVWDYFGSNDGNPVIAMPTGTGKSLVIAGFIKSVFDAYPNQRILVLTHVKELVEQNYDKILQLWPTAPAGIYSAGLNRKDLYSNVTFAGIASVARKPELFGHIDLILIDEAHLVSPNQSTMYQKFITELKNYNPYLKIIGLTATPYRVGQGHITEEGSIFTDICYDLTTLEAFNRLVAEGYLAPLVPKKTAMELNVDGVHIRGGEFIPKELQHAVDKYELTEAAVKEAMELAHDRRCWLVFTSGVEHAVHTCDMLNHYGISAKCVYSSNKEYKMSDKERDSIIKEFKGGKFQALVNNNILTTGFDHPGIDMIMVLRPTTSPGLWVQILGRGTRPVYADGFDLETIEGRLAAIENSEKRDCLVLDFGANTKRLGPINDPVVPKAKGKGTGEAPVRLCEGINKDNEVCNTWIHASLRVCPECGTEIQFQTKLKQSASSDELIKTDLPVVEEFKIDHITYSIHTKRDAPDMLKVSYYCGYKMFKEFVCLEHKGYAQHKALKWWRERTEMDPPSKVATALEMTSILKVCTSLRVWTNKKYPEIMAYCFDGSHFGREQVNESRPKVQTDKPKTLNFRT